MSVRVRKRTESRCTHVRTFANIGQKVIAQVNHFEYQNQDVLEEGARTKVHEIESQSGGRLSTKSRRRRLSCFAQLMFYVFVRQQVSHVFFDHIFARL